ncbi:ABC transporter substrate-binding protein [Streptomyces sp. C11-1]|uniref:ABC transporter substrate-binding protein n=1 Tax=Streptomyces durocortorensis TaxID=2811104 RepID=A0ABY9W4J7_9ACTN|nr:ABC transporter substrate-binding protein [Streptomyces durocortorensis]WNF30750.1 ABC transporter substrate-binding protein [Streptomyces durocortorensis]
MASHTTSHGIVNPSDRRGGTLRYVRTDDFDSLDPADTYYAYTWNFIRLIGRPLVGYATDGKGGSSLVPDLAEQLGRASDDSRTWTYRLREGIRFEDGTPVTSRDVKYAVLRAAYPEEVYGDPVTRGGPAYLRQYLTGPEGVETPDDRTVVFHLREPFAAFDYLAALPTTIPVPREHDDLPGYRRHPVSSGPYRIDSYTPGTELVLGRNPHWACATDPVRTALPDRITVRLGVSGQEVDRMLVEGEADIDLAGVGVQPGTQARLLADQDLMRQVDNPRTGFVWLYCINRNIGPLANIHARRAVQYATDKASMLAAYGGGPAGEIATTLLPSSVVGHEPFDRYPVGPGGTGDLEAAERELALAGRPDGFATRIAAREDRTKEWNAALALSDGLARVGIRAEVVPFTSGDYFTKAVGVPEFVRKHEIGIVMFGWAADFPDGYGFLQQIADSRAIKETGNQNLGELASARIDALLDAGAATRDEQERARIWAAVDRAAMDEAVMCPYMYVKSVVFRGARAANVVMSPAYGMYDYAVLSVADTAPPAAGGADDN